VQPTNRSLLGFEVQTGEPSTTLILRLNQETVATSFETKLEKTVATDYETKPEKTITTGFEAKPLTNHRPWF
jgi:hypothetical protein